MAKRSPLGMALAVGTIVGSLAVLGFYHRDDFASAPVESLSPEEQAFRACRDERAEGIQKMVDDGVINSEQQKQFLSRAEAMCQGQTGSGPSLPGLE